MNPTPPFLRGHSPLASWLYCLQLQGALAGGHPHAVLPPQQRARRFTAAPASVRPRRDNLEWLAAPERLRAGPGVVGASHPLDPHGRATPVDHAILLLQDLGVGRPSIVLRDRLQRTGSILG